MAEESLEGTYVSVGMVATIIFLGIIIITIAVRKLKQRAAKRNHEGIRIVHTKTASWYDPQLLKGVPRQVGHGNSHIDEGLLAVFTPEKKAMSAECILPAKSDSLHRSSLQRYQQLSISTQSLCSLPDEKSVSALESPRQSQTLKSSIYVAFNLLWSTDTASLSVHVARMTNLPPAYNNATCSYTVTVKRSDSMSISRTSNKFRKSSDDNDCSQMFTFPISLEEARQSELVIEVQARRSKHFLSCVIGDLHYQMPSKLNSNKQVSTKEPLKVSKQGQASSVESRKKSIFGPIGSLWGEVQVMAQYHSSGQACGRVKIMIVKGHSALVSKDTGSYKVEMTVKKGSETQTIFHTKTVRGPKPIWKAPFIFDVIQDKAKEYRVDLSLVRVSKIKKSTNIGHTALGLNTSATGTQHWQDIVNEPNREITMWHPITYADWM